MNKQKFLKKLMAFEDNNVKILYKKILKKADEPNFEQAWDNYSKNSSTVYWYADNEKEKFNPTAADLSGGHSVPWNQIHTVGLDKWYAIFTQNQQKLFPGSELTQDGILLQQLFQWAKQNNKFEQSSQKPSLSFNEKVKLVQTKLNTKKKEGLLGNETKGAMINYLKIKNRTPIADLLQGLLTDKEYNKGTGVYAPKDPKVEKIIDNIISGVYDQAQSTTPSTEDSKASESISTTNKPIKCDRCKDTKLVVYNNITSPFSGKQVRCLKCHPHDPPAGKAWYTPPNQSGWVYTIPVEAGKVPTDDNKSVRESQEK